MDLQKINPREYARITSPNFLNEVKKDMTLFKMKKDIELLNSLFSHKQ